MISKYFHIVFFLIPVPDLSDFPTLFYSHGWERICKEKEALFYVPNFLYNQPIDSIQYTVKEEDWLRRVAVCGSKKGHRYLL